MLQSESALRRTRPHEAGRPALAGICLLVLTAIAAPAWAQYAVVRFTVAGGGSTSTVGGQYTLGATIGQATAGRLSGGAYTLNGGFLPGGGGGVTAIEPGDAEPASPIPLALRLSPIAPNPFVTGRATVAFDLPQSGAARLLVYDVAGRLTRTLVDSALPAGRHRLAWDGTDDGGRHSAAGVYFLRLEQGDRIERQKLVIAR